MVGLLMESVVVAFVIGGVTGAVTALHLLGSKKIVGEEADGRRR